MLPVSSDRRIMMKYLIFGMKNLNKNCKLHGLILNNFLLTKY
jgi:hypothetical protein